MAKLVLHQPDGSMRDIRLDRDRLTIGRRPDNDLCLPFPPVSADHAEIITVATDSFLHDVGSTNGTLINGKRVTRHLLLDKDRIDIGRVQLVYLVNEAETVEPLPPDPEYEAWRNLMERVSAPQVGFDADASEEEETHDEHIAPVDELLSDLMETGSATSVAIDMPPTVSVVEAPKTLVTAREVVRKPDIASRQPVVEVLNGPNAGQATPMTKREFLLGRSGHSIASIRQEGRAYWLRVLDAHQSALHNGKPVPQQGVVLAFGDTIDVAGVKLRFARAAS